jgi:glycosyltransferase involved in cell wall biosynthesis
MRLLFVADGRSPTALNWIEYFLDRDNQVHLVSTFACAADPRLASFQVVPVAFSSVKSAPGGPKSRAGKVLGLLGTPAIGLRTRLRHWLGPLTLPKAAQCLRTVIEAVQPDLVHAMRIPYEGMLAALAGAEAPLVISVWGNDFTLHAPSTPLMARYTCLALKRAAALHADCQRDLRLGRDWGFPEDKPAVVLPGAGGVQAELFYPPEIGNAEGADNGNCLDRTRRVINPRGFRAYVRNDTFFKAIPLVLARRPETRFVCPVMAEEPQARRWVDELGIQANVDLLPRQTRPQMAALFRSAQVAVSPTTHDGTPNTLLEAMACGCFPVAGDLESLREWIIPGVNGLLVDPADPQALAQGILQGLEDENLDQGARAYNLRLIAERAAYELVMEQAQEFYRQII